MKTACTPCTDRPSGETGHAALSFYVSGPYPGHSIFNCATCGERWIRHLGTIDRFGWTRYFEQFPSHQRELKSAA